MIQGCPLQRLQERQKTRRLAEHVKKAVAPAAAAVHILVVEESQLAAERSRLHVSGVRPYQTLLPLPKRQTRVGDPPF
ncbi:hypothetical protein ANO14919_047200 [Xylariales sp. No.14919]|nr:hypothetical protein ANO14919_047200 [Xylariales sp. No.14919]